MRAGERLKKISRNWGVGDNVSNSAQMHART